MPTTTVEIISQGTMAVVCRKSLRKESYWGKSYGFPNFFLLTFSYIFLTKQSRPG